MVGFLSIAAIAACSSSGSPSAPAGPEGPSGTLSGSSGSSGTTAVSAARAAGVAPSGRSPGCRGESASLVKGSHTDEQLRSGGVARSFKQWVPSSYSPPAAMALVVDLHGYAEGNAVHTVMSNMGPFGESHGFVTVTPLGTGKIPFWNAVPVADGPNDVQFISDLIDSAGASLCLDLTRVYVTGLSNGAFMASLVACRLADKVAAIAPVAGLMMPPGCTPSREVPIVAFHGTADAFVSYDSDRPGPAAQKLTFDADSQNALGNLPFKPIPETLAAWAGLEGCAPAPITDQVTASVKLIRYERCRGGSVVSLYAISGGGHAWPGSAFSASIATVVGPTTTEIDADTLMWAFFQRFSLGA